MGNKNPYLFMFREMRKYAPSKKMLFLMLSFSAVSKLLRLVEPWVMGKLINMVQVEGIAARPMIWKILLGLVVLHLFAWMFHGSSRIWEEKIKFDVAAAYVSQTFHKVASLPMQRHNDNHSGETIDKINKAMYAIREFSGSNFMYLGTIFYSVGALVSLALIRWPAAVILGLFAGFAFFIVWRFDKIIVPLIKQKNRKEHVVMSTLFDLLSNIKTVITLRFEERALDAVRTKIYDVFPVFRDFSLWNEWKWFSMDMVMNMVVMTTLGYYIYTQFHAEGIVLIGTMMMVYQYIQKMRDAFDNFTWQYSGIVTKKADMEAVADIDEAYAALSDDYSTELDNWSAIHLHGLHFTYEDIDEHEHTLSNIDIRLAPGKKIALVGESGSGKSTLLSLLRGLYDVDQVMLSVDDTEYDSLHVLAHTTSLIPQEPEIFEQTIRYNLSMGLDIDDVSLWKALEIACMDEVVRGLYAGLDTDIKEKGVNLSGGQKQRLALARGLLMAQDSDILLLDEPTSSVDSVNEVRIHEHIFATYPEKCIIASIHKLHLLEFFDEIYVLDEGKVVEVGSLDELKKNKGMLTTMLDEYQV